MASKNKTIRMCPIKETHVYHYVCIEKCKWFEHKKCPIQSEVEGYEADCKWSSG